MDLFELLLTAALLLLGYGAGTVAEKRHYRSIREREAQLRDLHVLAVRIPVVSGPVETQLVTGSVVVSIDYFKRFLAGLRNLVGGRVSAYETLVDRGRREAILRMKEAARAQGAQYVFNVKFETARVYYNAAKNGIGSVEVLAYGTALKRL